MLSDTLQRETSFRYVLTRNPQGLTIHIPVSVAGNGVHFDPNSRHSCVIKFKVKRNRTLVINKDFVSKVVLLSYHVLEIVKKQKNKTLDRYLDRILHLKLLPKNNLPF